MAHAKTDLIMDLYLNQRKPILEIIKELGVAGKTVRKILALNGYKCRTRNASREKGLTKEQLIALKAEGLSVKEMSVRLGICNGSIHNYLVKYGLNNMSPAEAKAAKGLTILWTEEKLAVCKKLLEDGLTYKEAGTELGCTESAVDNINRSKLHVLGSIWQDECLTNQVKETLEKERNYATTAFRFNVSEETIRMKNQRSWHIDLSMNSTLFGIPTDFNGVLYRSKKEAIIAQYLTEKSINFEYEKKVAEGERWTCDFYLPDYDMWIEYDGLEENRDQTKAIPYNRDNPKIRHYQSNGYRHMILGKRSWKEQLDRFFKDND